MAIPEEPAMNEMFPGRPAGGPPGSRRPAKGPPRFFAVDRTQVYSLKDAARALEIPEGALRRAVLMEDLRAMEVDDDRHYLLAGAALQEFLRRRHPDETCVFPDEDSLLPDLLTFLIIPILIVLALLFVKSPDGHRADPAAKTAPAAAAPAPPSGDLREGMPPSPVRPALDPDSPGPLPAPNY
jgi:hypothetical protein